MKKVLIIDPELGYLESLIHLIADDFSVECCTDFSELTQMIPRNSPDFLIINLVCTNFDGFAVLDWLNGMGIFPTVIGIIQSSNFYMEVSMRKYNIAFHLTRPFCAKTVASRLTMLANLPKEKMIDLPTRRELVTEILNSLGISYHIGGGKNLVEAVLAYADDSELQFTKQLYPLAGERTGHSGPQVERNIRTAIDSGWSQQEKYAWKHYFLCDENGLVPKPSNSELIKVLAAVLNNLKGQYKNV